MVRVAVFGTPANHGHIRVMKGVAAICLDPEVGGIDLALGGFEAVAEFAGGIGRNQHMAGGGTAHGDDFPGEIFAFSGSGAVLG